MGPRKARPEGRPRESRAASLPAVPLPLFTSSGFLASLRLAAGTTLCSRASGPLARLGRPAVSRCSQKLGETPGSSPRPRPEKRLASLAAGETPRSGTLASLVHHGPRSLRSRGLRSAYPQHRPPPAGARSSHHWLIDSETRSRSRPTRRPGHSASHRSLASRAISSWAGNHRGTASTSQYRSSSPSWDSSSSPPVTSHRYACSTVW